LLWLGCMPVVVGTVCRGLCWAQRFESYPWSFGAVGLCCGGWFPAGMLLRC